MTSQSRAPRCTWKLTKPSDGGSDFLDFPAPDPADQQSWATAASQRDCEGKDAWIGRKVAVWWPTEQHYYPGHIISYKAPKRAGNAGKYRFAYEDGDGETVDAWDAGTIFINPDYTINLNDPPVWHSFHRKAPSGILKAAPPYYVLTKEKKKRAASRPVEPGPHKKAKHFSVDSSLDSAAPKPPKQYPSPKMSPSLERTHRSPGNAKKRRKRQSAEPQDDASGILLEPSVSTAQPAQDVVNGVEILQEPVDVPGDEAPQVLARVTRSRSTVVSSTPPPAVTMPLEQQVRVLYQKLYSMYTSMALALGIDEPAPVNIETALLWDPEACFSRFMAPQIEAWKQAAHFQQEILAASLQGPSEVMESPQPEYLNSALYQEPARLAMSPAFLRAERPARIPSAKSVSAAVFSQIKVEPTHIVNPPILPLVPMTSVLVVQAEPASELSHHESEPATQEHSESDMEM